MMSKLISSQQSYFHADFGLDIILTGEAVQALPERNKGECR